VLAALLNAPSTPGDWEIWSMANYDALNQIRAAIQTQKGVTLPSYQVQPIPFDDIDSWLDAVQQAQDDFSKVLGLQANDLLGVDFKDTNQKEAWIWLYFKGVSDACNVLRIGP